MKINSPVGEIIEIFKKYQRQAHSSGAEQKNILKKLYGIL